MYIDLNVIIGLCIQETDKLLFLYIKNRKALLSTSIQINHLLNQGDVIYLNKISLVKHYPWFNRERFNVYINVIISASGTGTVV